MGLETGLKRKGRPALMVEGNEMVNHFHSDGSRTSWGYKMTVKPEPVKGNSGATDIPGEAVAALPLQTFSALQAVLLDGVVQVH